ncbi:MAG: hypothetical protein ACRBG0_26915 [Lewinella sp.]|uniref:hypothetical protein n=1 Tax=Lewinella sp. TaxID=2004506 RepID=UPI003D6B0014
MDQAPKAINKPLKQLLIAGFGWGLICTIVLLVFPSLRGQDSIFIAALYYFFIIVLAATLTKNIRQYGSYWIQLKSKKPAIFWGQLMGIGVFGSLFAVVIYHLLLLAGPYFGNVEDWSTFVKEMGITFSAFKILILLVCTAFIAIVTINMLKENEE